MQRILVDGLDHKFGIVMITEYRRGVLQYAPANRRQWQSPSQTVGAVVRGFKSVITKRADELRQTPGANYSSSIIGSTSSATNPNWTLSTNTSAAIRRNGNWIACSDSPRVCPLRFGKPMQLISRRMTPTSTRHGKPPAPRVRLFLG